MRTASLLYQHGHDVEVFTLSDRRESFDHESIRVHRVPAWPAERLVRKTQFLRRMHGYAKVLSRAGALDRALRTRHRECHFDLVQAVSSHACGLVASFRRIAPLVTFANGYYPKVREVQGAIPSATDAQIDKASFWQMRRSDAVHAPSQLVAGLLRDEQDISADVIEYAYDPGLLSNRSWAKPEQFEGDYGLYFGALNRLKGCDRLVDALDIALTQQPDMRFTFIGKPDNNSDELIREKLRSFGSRVAVLPALPPDELFRYVSHAKFVVLPSRTDNLPNACLEAMALRRVVIATRDASFEQLIEHDTNGFLVSQTDDDELAHCMLTTWNMNARKLSDLGEKACRSLDRLKPERTLKTLLNLFEGAVHQSRLSGRSNRSSTGQADSSAVTVGRVR